MNYAKICPRKSTKTEWETHNPVLIEGEMGIEYPDNGIDSGYVKIKFGDGITPWNDLAYGINEEFARAIHGGNPIEYKDIWLRSGTGQEWTETDPILGMGEIVYDFTENSLKVGDGVHRFTELAYITGSGGSGISDYDFGDEDSESSCDIGDYDFGDDDFDYDEE